MDTRLAVLDYTPPLNLLENRVILVTGAGDGIGRVAAKTFAQHGAEVILLGRTPANLVTVYDEIEAAGGKKPAIYPMNLEGATMQDYHTLCETLDKEFGALHGILHNAAWLGAHTPLAFYDVKQWFKVLQINLNAPFFMTQALLPLLKKTDHASVVFTIDEAGLQGQAYKGAYGVSKFGLQGLMQTFAEEFEANTSIRFNSINPGPVATKMRRIGYPGEDASLLRRPEEIIAPYLYLMGNDSIGINGQTFSCQKANQK
jgi:NAD(P)-dependent dehydrogenase (short-subunit alcohol dehydrogenase family)